jgi:hypothetical protein
MFLFSSKQSLRLIAKIAVFPVLTEETPAINEAMHCGVKRVRASHEMETAHFHQF